MEMDALIEIFSKFQSSLDAEQSKREMIKALTKDIEENARKLITLLQVIHQEISLDMLTSTFEKSKMILVNVKRQYADLSELVEPGNYYKFYDHWKLVTQKLCFVITLIHYLERKTLMTRDEVAADLGLASFEKDGFHLPIEDYLYGVLTLITELARLAVNSVTNGDYRKPMEISQFVSEVHAGFRLLSMKNDHLRKRFDVLKYDVKKIEEVVYDLSIRGLKPTE